MIITCYPAPDRRWWDEPALRAALAARDIRAILVLLQQRGMSQRALAEHTGFTPGEIHEILWRGRRVVSYDVLARLADMLGIPRWRMGLSAEPPADAACAHCRTARNAPPLDEPADNHETENQDGDRVRAEMLPPDWWRRPHLVTALAAHDFATVFAQLRTFGLTSHAIATRTGLRPSHVDSILAGQGSLTGYDDLAVVCDGLGIDRGAAGLAYLNSSTDDSEPVEQRGTVAGLPATWTGAHAEALRVAMRHTVAAFAARLGVTERTVANWQAGGRSIRPRRDIQLRLDALFCTLRSEARSLYARLLLDLDAADRTQAR